MVSGQKKYKRKGKPVQLYMEEELKHEFQMLVRHIDPLLSLNRAVLKLIIESVRKQTLPGYSIDEEASHRVSGPVPRQIGESKSKTAQRID